MANSEVLPLPRPTIILASTNSIAAAAAVLVVGGALVVALRRVARLDAARVLVGE